MKDKRKRILRAAAALHQQYQELNKSDAGHAKEQLDGYIPPLLEHARQRAIRFAEMSSRGWNTAARTVQQECKEALDDLAKAIQRLRDTMALPEPELPSASDLFRELLAVQDDFGEVLVEDKGIAVLSDSIRLEGFNLGSFKILLEWDEFVHCDPERWFRVVAEDPNPAQNNDQVTHPHVSDERLCAGDASAPIRSSLRGGRLSEFFLLVRSVLDTYNANSAYVRLDDWHGIGCDDCGDLIDPDDACFCNMCEKDFCIDCIRSCTDCNTHGCRNCLSTSELSEEWVCEECMTRCTDCGLAAALSELNEQCRCGDCEDTLDSEQETDDDDAPAQPCASPTNPAIQPDGQPQVQPQAGPQTGAAAQAA